MDKMLA